ncbi:MAG: RsmE family RNA methyltransferase [Helicobacteraceae bacterium]|jgi:16S rRNA (uracil1498-N3)-methyltransferase|nr:RsmE family RNA methyltransferase [Helicobacteraceae bacterium]
MRFLFHDGAGSDRLIADCALLRHIKALRLIAGSTLFLRNLRDNRLYSYRIAKFLKREAVLELIGSEEKIILPARKIELAWCVVDPKVIEKTMPALNELGVAVLHLIRCEKSQRNHRVNMNRLERIAVLSCEQCGRSAPIAIKESGCFEFANNNPSALLFDFGGAPVNPQAIAGKTVVVGPEGGFGENDYEAFKGLARIGINSPLVLRSESAAIAAAAMLAAYSPIHSGTQI